MKYLTLLCLFALTLLSCPSPKPTPATSSTGTVPAAGPVKNLPAVSTLNIANDTANSTKVFLAFGSDSVVLPSSAGMEFCSGSGLTCSFVLAKHATKNVPLAGKYLNATVSFDAPVTCGVTKAELNLNNEAWFDTLDVSLVDGFSNLVAIDAVSSAGSVTLGPPNGVAGNEKVFGLFPNGCDICTARQTPPCGMTPGTDGCKTGTQYKPDVPCQWQGPTMGGGTQAAVRLVAGIPLK